MASVKHNIFLFYYIFVSYFMTLTKTSKIFWINTCFLIKNDQKKEILHHLASIHWVPAMGTWQAKCAVGHWIVSLGKRDILKPALRAELSRVLLLCELNKGNLVPNSIKFGKKFFTLSWASVSQIWAHLSPKRSHTCMFFGLSKWENEVRAEFPISGQYAKLVEMCIDYLHPRCFSEHLVS